MHNFQYADQHLQFVCNAQQLPNNQKQNNLNIHKNQSNDQNSLQHYQKSSSPNKLIQIQNVKKNDKLKIIKMQKKSKNVITQIKKMESTFNKNKLASCNNQNTLDLKQSKQIIHKMSPFSKYKRSMLEHKDQQKKLFKKYTNEKTSSTPVQNFIQSKICNQEFEAIDRIKKANQKKQSNQMKFNTMSHSKSTSNLQKKSRSCRKMSYCQREHNILSRLCLQLDKVENKNQDQSVLTEFKTARTLKRSKTACSIATKIPQYINQFKQPQPKEQVQSNQARISNLYYCKMRQRVMTQMEKYKKVKQTRKEEDKKHALSQNSRKRKNQHRSTFLIEGVCIETQKKRLEIKSKKKYEEPRRPTTALTRTGLQYTNRQSERRAMSIKQRDNVQELLAGPNNKANHFFNFSKNANRDVEQLNQSKTDRVMRTLKKMERQSCRTSRIKTSQNGYKERPKTGRSAGTCKSSIGQCFQRLTVNKKSSSIDYQQITKRQIAKQVFKQKALDVIIKCEQQKNQNVLLKKGMDIFQFYCQNVDEGLKEIQQTLQSYIKKIE